MSLPLGVREIARRLEPWKRCHDDLMAQYESLKKLTGAMPDCELMQPVFALFDAYTEALAEIVGDKDNWLAWYYLECDMGRKPMEARSAAGVVMQVRSLRQLARAISW